MSLEAAINKYEDIIKDQTGKEMNLDGWLHHAVLLTTQETQNPKSAADKLNRFQRNSGIEFYFTLISQVSNTDNLALLVNELEGQHYAVKAGTVMSRAFGEALGTKAPKNH